MDIGEKSLELHRRLGGKLETVCKMRITGRDELSLLYTPGVARPCLEIQKDPALSYVLTGRGDTVAVVSDGTAVLGLGDIGPEASMPVMEGKCALFKEFGGVNAVPLCVRSKEPDDIVNAVALLAGSFGGINLEDISAPRCFEIEERLRAVCDIPVFHDDQHGTAVVTLAALTNALKLTRATLAESDIVISGAGAAGTAIALLLAREGARSVVVCDTRGAIYAGREGLNPAKEALAGRTNVGRKKGALADVLRGANVFIGVSAAGIVSEGMVRSMADGAIVFACANPTPEISPELARAAGAAVVATGRSDYPNQLNNVLAFPGIFRGALDARASDINDEMKRAAATAIASLVGDGELCPEYILPAPFDARVGETVAAAVAKAARESGVARV